MGTFSLVLVLASAFLHAGWNALLKRTEDVETASAGVFLVALVATATLTVMLPGPAFASRAGFLFALAAGVGEGGYFVCLTRALDKVPLGWAYTWMRGSAVAFAWPLSILLMGERLRLAGAISVLGVVAGLGLMGQGKGGSKARGALFWVLLSGVFISGFNAAYKAALDHGAHPVPLFMVSMAVGLPIQLSARVGRHGWRSLGRVPRFPGLVLVAGLVCTAAFLCYLAALRKEGSGLVLTVRNVSVVFAMAFGFLLGEKARPRQWLGALLVMAGAMGLSLPGR